MQRTGWGLLMAAAMTVSGPGQAALKLGDPAPPFTLAASLGGDEFEFSLEEALRDGPVVLYFYPAAFTPGCTIEAHQFAEATDEFQALGATIIGVSADDIDTLNRFSVSECRGKFPVAADADGRVMKAYDAVLRDRPEYASRTSYVISPEGRILMSYTDMKPDQHVERTMAAVREWRQAQP